MSWSWRAQARYEQMFCPTCWLHQVSSPKALHLVPAGAAAATAQMLPLHKKEKKAKCAAANLSDAKGACVSNALWLRDEMIAV